MAKNNWDKQRDEESRQKYNMMQSKVKVGSGKGKRKIHAENCVRNWIPRKRKRIHISWLSEEIEQKGCPTC